LEHRGHDGWGAAFIDTDSKFLHIRDTWKRVADDGTLHVVDGVDECRPFPVVLMHGRLAIQDLTEAGDQPMLTQNGRFIIVFNGEIYNFRELRRELEGMGHRFHSDTDTEVVLAAYIRWGKGCLDRFNGMFSFVIHDSFEYSTFCARDRMGIKPLYYAVVGDTVVFSSEIKGVLATGLVDPAPDMEALWHMMSLQVTPRPLTAFEGIRELLPGCYFDFDEEGFSIHEWFSLPPTVEGPDTSKNVEEDFERAVTDFVDLFSKAVMARLIADPAIPVGLLLSGGIDSSLICAVAAREGGRPLHTITMGLGKEFWDMDESPLAAMTAAQYGTIHHPFVLGPDEIIKAIPETMWSLEEPFPHLISFETLTYRKAREFGIPVILTGVGGDELFAGYNYHLSHGGRRKHQIGYLEKIPPALPRFASGNRNNPLYDKARGILSLTDSFPGWYYWLKALFTEGEKDRLFLSRPPGVDTEAWVRQRYADPHIGSHDRCSQICYMDQMQYLPDDLLTHTDRLSMASTIEVRAPFLDHALVEFSYSLPEEIKLRDGISKAILRRAARDLLGPDVVGARKRGFSIPLGHWMNTDLRPMFEELLDQDTVRSRGLFDPAEVKAIKKDFFTCRMRNPQKLYLLASIELWFRSFIDRKDDPDWLTSPPKTLFSQEKEIHTTIDSPNLERTKPLSV